MRTALRERLWAALALASTALVLGLSVVFLLYGMLTARARKARAAEWMMLKADRLQRRDA